MFPIPTDPQMDPLTAQLDTEVAKYRSAALASSSKAAYRTHLRAYFQFCDLLGCPPVPISTLNTCRFAAFLARRLKFTSIQQYLNILRVLHLELGLPNPILDNWHLRSLLQGIKKSKADSTNRKLPITPELLLKFHSVLSMSDPTHIVFWAAFCERPHYFLLRLPPFLLPGTSLEVTSSCSLGA